jgi:hypothetical protein
MLAWCHLLQAACAKWLSHKNRRSFSIFLNLAHATLAEVSRISSGDRQLDCVIAGSMTFADAEISAFDPATDRPRPQLDARLLSHPASHARGAGLSGAGPESARGWC